MVTDDKNRIPISTGMSNDIAILIRLRQSVVDKNQLLLAEIDNTIKTFSSIASVPLQEPTEYPFPIQPKKNKMLFLLLEAHEQIGLRWVTTEYPYGIPRIKLAEKLSQVVGWTVTKGGIDKAINEGQKDMKDKNHPIHYDLEVCIHQLKKIYRINDA